MKKNISVVTIKPGFVRTPMTDGFERDGVLWADPEKIAKGIVNAMRKGKGGSIFALVLARYYVYY